MASKKLLRVVLFALLPCLLFSLAACGLMIQQKNKGLPIPLPNIPSKVEEPKRVEVIFTVQSPKVDLDEFTLCLDVFDDLSGYQENISRYPMKNIGDNQFEVSVLLDEGFDVRYRYVISEPAEVFETTPTGQTVGFRIAVVEEGLRISDQISNWTQSFMPDADGKISGYIKDHQTQKGVADVLISIGGMRTFTDMTGYFSIDKLVEGTYSFVALASDGSYAAFQQSAKISPGETTRVEISLVPLEKVTLRFRVQPSSETVGVPIRLAGNFVGFGAYYSSDFLKSGSIASLMPLLTQEEDGTYSINLDLYAGSAFRYRYTMGNGYINAERNDHAHLVTRKFIVPGKSATVKDQILTWRADQSMPITIHVDVPFDTPPNETVSIQFFNKTWNQPIPMWKVRDQKWMFLLFSNGYEPTAEFRFCRNDNCEFAWGLSGEEQSVQVNFNESDTFNYQINAWHNWGPEGKLSPAKENQTWPKTLSGVELSQDFHAGALPYMLQNLSELKESGVNWIIIRPTWDVIEVDGVPAIRASERDFMLFHELAKLVTTAQQVGLKVSLYPKLTYPAPMEDWWNSATRSDAFWQHWYQQYDQFLNNYSIFAQLYKVDHFILGEDGVHFSLPGDVMSLETNLEAPETAGETWTAMLNQVRKNYNGKLLWASSLTNNLEQSFFDQFDGYYVLVNHSRTIFNEDSVQQAFENFFTAIKDKENKPIFIALNLPALNSEAMEYTDHMEPISPGSANGNGDFVDLAMQKDLYEAFSCTLGKNESIAGLSSRGFYLAHHLTDFSSSVFGKPAFEAFLTCSNNSQ